jgi:hypothetical protein
MMNSPTSRRSSLASEAGFSLAEMLIATAVGTLIMGLTMSAMHEAMRASESVARLTNMNYGLRTAMDLMVRDFLQVGSGLPPSHVILIPSGAGSSLIKIPGPPGTNFTTVANDPDMAAIIPGTGLGPTINGTPTDVITVLTADNAFANAGVTAVTSTSVTIAPGFLPVGSDRINRGDLMMITKGSLTTLVQVTNVNTGSRVLSFQGGDSLNLNQPGAAAGSLNALNLAVPNTSPAREQNTSVTRVRMISYYIDTVTTPGRTRLTRRMNAGHHQTFDNTLGTVVAFDVENLQITYDIADGATNPSNVRFTAADIAGTGACSPNPCTPIQIRKINLALTGRANTITGDAKTAPLRNTLTSQVSLRGMAFLNEYQPTQ